MFNRSTFGVASLVVLLACNGTSELLPDGEFAEEEISQRSVRTLGVLEIGGALDEKGTPEDGPGAPQKQYRGYSFEVRDAREEFVSATVTYGTSPEAVILNSRYQVVAKSTREDSPGGRVRSAVIPSVSFPEAGTYLLAFRDTGVSKSSETRPVAIHLKYDLPKLHATRVSCQTRRTLEGKREKFDFDAAFLGHAVLRPQLLPQPGSEEYTPFVLAKDGSYAAVLNENTSFETTKDRLRIGGDSDGLAAVDAVLFKDSGYQTGYLRATTGDKNAPGGYSELDCAAAR